jgi:DNA-binding MarR family transcriptional regulator
MDNLELRTLRLLEVLEGNQVLSQRELAQRLDVSLGLVNSFVRRLAKKGYFKITTIPQNRVKYILTPKGIAEKSKLTYQYIQYSYSFYKEARFKLKRVFDELSRERVKRVVFYGIGNFAEIAYFSLMETDIKLIAVVDDHKVGHRFMGLRTQSPDSINSFRFQRIINTAITSKEQVRLNILARGITDDKIVTFE